MARKLLIDPLDLSQFTPDTTSNPGFTDLATSALGDSASDADGWDDAVSDGLGLVDALDRATAAMDADLDAILALLAESDTGAAEQHLVDYQATIPAGEQLVSDAGALSAPELRPLALVEPAGQATITLGGPPEQGGVPKAGGQPYTLHLALLGTRGGIHNVDADGGSGPNPPFAGFGPVVKETGADGIERWTYLVQINPQTPGTYTGVAQYQVNLTITGITGTITRTLPFQVVISP
jgi:hypothetical protein